MEGLKVLVDFKDAGRACADGVNSFVQNEAPELLGHPVGAKTCLALLARVSYLDLKLQLSITGS